MHSTFFLNKLFSPAEIVKAALETLESNKKRTPQKKRSSQNKKHFAILDQLLI
jgi:hypothetical protein